MSGSTTMPSIMNMPHPWSKEAPKKFKGDYRSIRDFLDFYERLLARHSITDESDKCKTIRQYCSSSVRETIEGLADFHVPNWDKLKATLLKLYDSDLNDQRYTERDLISHVRVSRDQDFTSLKGFRAYERNFHRIAGWLKSKSVITEEQMSHYFWRGLSRKLRDRVEIKLSIGNASIDCAKPFPVSDVTSVIETLLMRNRFDADDSDYDQKIDLADPLSESDSSSDSDSGSDNESRKKKTKHKSKKLASKRLETKDKERRETETPESKKSKLNEGDEVESLIKQLGRMSLEDPEYGLMYYRAIVLDSRVEKVVRPPKVSGSRNGGNSSVKPPSGDVSKSPFMCYGCGATDHGLNNCPSMNELMAKGVIKKDSSNKYCMSDGSRIFKTKEENFVQAVQRIMKASSQVNHFIVDSVTHLPKVASHVVTHGGESEDSDEESEEEVYEAQRQPKIGKEKRKERFEGVFPPPRQAHKERKKKMDSSVPQPVPQPISSHETIPVTVPIDVHQPTFDPDNDEEIMEDVINSKVKSTRKPASPRVSKVSKVVSPLNVLEKALGTSMSISVGELLGVSKEVSTLLQDAIRFKKNASEEDSSKKKSQETVNINTENVYSLRSGPLIKISVECNGNPIRAIIDTGSTCNIVHQQVYERFIKSPIDLNDITTINDANGGEQRMLGCVRNVKLSCGAVETVANLFVAAHAPFDLLLGRPWQRGNFVSIEERPAGTFLVFRSSSNPQIRYELLVERPPRLDSFHADISHIVPGDPSVFQDSDCQNDTMNSQTLRNEKISSWVIDELRGQSTNYVEQNESLYRVPQGLLSPLQSPNLLGFSDTSSTVSLDDVPELILNVQPTNKGTRDAGFIQQSMGQLQSSESNTSWSVQHNKNIQQNVVYCNLIVDKKFSLFDRVDLSACDQFDILLLLFEHFSRIVEESSEISSDDIIVKKYHKRSGVDAPPPTPSFISTTITSQLPPNHPLTPSLVSLMSRTAAELEELQADLFMLRELFGELETVHELHALYFGHLENIDQNSPIVVCLESLLAQLQWAIVAFGNHEAGYPVTHDNPLPEIPFEDMPLPLFRPTPTSTPPPPYSSRPTSPLNPLVDQPLQSVSAPNLVLSGGDAACCADAGLVESLSLPGVSTCLSAPAEDPLYDPFYPYFSSAPDVLDSHIPVPPTPHISSTFVVDSSLLPVPGTPFISTIPLPNISSPSMIDPVLLDIGASSSQVTLDMLAQPSSAYPTGFVPDHSFVSNGLLEESSGQGKRRAVEEEEEDFNRLVKRLRRDSFGSVVKNEDDDEDDEDDEGDFFSDAVQFCNEHKVFQWKTEVAEQPFLENPMCNV
jgi:hypothetical protein